MLNAIQQCRIAVIRTLTGPACVDWCTLLQERPDGLDVVRLHRRDDLVVQDVRRRFRLRAARAQRSAHGSESHELNRKRPSTAHEGDDVTCCPEIVPLAGMVGYNRRRTTVSLSQSATRTANAEKK